MGFDSLILTRLRLLGLVLLTEAATAACWYAGTLKAEVPLTTTRTTASDVAPLDVAVALAELDRQEVTSTSPFNVSIGGYYVNGAGDRSKLHPLVERGEQVRPQLIAHFAEAHSYRALLVCNGIDHIIGPLELRIMFFQKIESRDIRHAAARLNGSARRFVGPADVDVNRLSADDRRTVARLVSGLARAEVSHCSHFVFCVDDMVATHRTTVGRNSHPLLEFGADALPILAAQIERRDAPLPELLIMAGLGGEGFATLGDHILNGNRDSRFDADLLLARLRVLCIWSGSVALEQGRSLLDQAE